MSEPVPQFPVLYPGPAYGQAPEQPEQQPADSPTEQPVGQPVEQPRSAPALSLVPTPTAESVAATTPRPRRTTLRTSGDNPIHDALAAHYDVPVRYLNDPPAVTGPHPVLG